MYGDDKPLDELKREMQEQATIIREQGRRIYELESWRVSISELLEDRDQH